MIINIHSEPGENHHKYLRYYRAHHAPQTSLIENLESVFLRCIQISDPINLKLMGQLEPRRKITPLPPKVKALLLNPPSDDPAPMEIDEDEDEDMDEEGTNFFDPGPQYESDHDSDDDMADDQNL